MRRTRLWGFLPIPLVVAVVSVFAPAAEYNSATERLLRSLHHELLWVAVPLAVIVEAALFYAMIKFHDNDDPKPTKQNRRLEITWTIATAVVLLFVGASSYMVLASPMVSTQPGQSHVGSDAVDVHIVGQNWFWRFEYPDSNVTTTNTLVLPANRTVFFTITSKDVVHSVHIPALGIKEDAFPGRTNTYRTHLTDTGTYRLYCAEFCGTGHSKMLATVKVVSPERYQQWLRKQKRDASGSSGNASSKNATTGSA